MSDKEWCGIPVKDLDKEKLAQALANEIYVADQLRKRIKEVEKALNEQGYSKAK